MKKITTTKDLIEAINEYGGVFFDNLIIYDIEGGCEDNNYEMGNGIYLKIIDYKNKTLTIQCEKNHNVEWEIYHDLEEELEDNTDLEDIIESLEESLMDSSWDLSVELMEKNREQILNQIEEKLLEGSLLPNMVVVGVDFTELENRTKINLTFENEEGKTFEGEISYLLEWKDTQFLWDNGVEKFFEVAKEINNEDFEPQENEIKL